MKYGEVRKSVDAFANCELCRIYTAGKILIISSSFAKFLRLDIVVLLSDSEYISPNSLHAAAAAITKRRGRLEEPRRKCKRIHLTLQRLEQLNTQSVYTPNSC